MTSREQFFSEKLEASITPLIQQIEKHPLFESIQLINDLKIFSEHHVFAVWDFMCLIKKLQSKITCITVPWFPPINPLGARLINEMVMEEESDIVQDQRYVSHFELYIEAMQECGANTETIQKFLSKLQSGQSVDEALQNEKIPSAAKKFVKNTFKILEKDIHQLIAAFVYGRESITDKMFFPILNHLNKAGFHNTSKFQYYFKRHIELDKNNHAPKARQLLMSACGADKEKWAEATEIALFALQARSEFLNAIHEAIEHSKNRSIVDQPALLQASFIYA